MKQNLFLLRDSLSRPWGFRLQNFVSQDVGELSQQFVVQRVFSGSPADGILHKGDIVLSVDGQEITRLSHKHVLDLIRISGGNLSLEIDRGADIVGHTISPLHPPTNRNNTQQGPIPVEWSISRVTPSVNPLFRQPAAFESYIMPITRTHSSHKDQILTNIANDPDYEFTRQSVRERSRAFLQADRSKTVPNAKVSTTPRHYTASNIARFHSNKVYGPSKAPDFGWAPSQDKIKKARSLALSSASMGHMHQNNRSSLWLNDEYQDNTSPRDRVMYRSSTHIAAPSSSAYSPWNRYDTAPTGGQYQHHLSVSHIEAAHPAHSRTRSADAWMESQQRFQHLPLSKSRPLKINLYESYDSGSRFSHFGSIMNNSRIQPQQQPHQHQHQHQYQHQHQHQNQHQQQQYNQHQFQYYQNVANPPSYRQPTGGLRPSNQQVYRLVNAESQPNNYSYSLPRNFTVSKPLTPPEWNSQSSRRGGRGVVNLEASEARYNEYGASDF